MAPAKLCSKHPPEEHWRLRADSARTPADEPGPWACQVCHPMPEPLRVESEQFDLSKGHVDPYARTYREEDYAPNGNIIGSVSAVTLTLDKATTLIEKWKAEEFGWVKMRILALADTYGEYHADLLVGVRLDSPNMVGAAVNALARQGLLEKLNRHGEVEHRQTLNGKSRRASYVWRLTPNGASAVARWRKLTGAKKGQLPGPPRPAGESGEVLRDGISIQEVLT